MLLTEIFFQTIRFMDKEVCHHLWRSCANDSSRKGLFPTATTEGVRPREMGRYRRSYELGGQARVIRMSLGIGIMIWK